MKLINQPLAENLQLKLFRLSSVYGINTLAQIYFCAVIILFFPFVSVNAEEQKNAPRVVAEFQLMSNGKHNGFASLLINEFVTYQNKVVIPTGALVPYIAQIIDQNDREINFVKKLQIGDQLFLIHEVTNNIDFYAIKALSGESSTYNITGTSIVFCQASEPSPETCYWIKSASLKIENQYSSINVNSNNTASIFYELIRHNKSVGDIKMKTRTIKNIAKLITLEDKERLADEQKKLEIDKAIIARALHDHELYLWKEKQKEERDRINKILTDTKSGTNIFCRSSNDSLAAASDRISGLMFTCDLLGSESIGVNLLFNAGWELISENRVAVQGFSGVGYIVHLRFRKN